MSKYGRVCWLIQLAANAGSGAATITVESCTNAAAAGTTNIPFDYWSQTTATDTWSDKTTATSAGFVASKSCYQIALEPENYSVLFRTTILSLNGNL